MAFWLASFVFLLHWFRRMATPVSPSASDWSALAAREDFHRLLAAKKRFIIPATLFFLLYYMALPVLVGFWPEVMKKPVWGEVNLAYAFALSQFLMTFVMAGIYVAQARKWDRMEHALLESINLSPSSPTSH